MKPAEFYAYTTKVLLSFVVGCFTMNLAGAMVINADQASSSRGENGGVLSTTGEVLTQSDKEMCTKGHVFVNNQCVSCTSNVVWKNYAQKTRVYCPGLKWININLSLDKQLQKCPAGSWPNDDLTGCVCAYGKTKSDGSCESITLNKEQLYYGPQGRNAPLHEQCWTKTVDAAYKACMGFDSGVDFSTTPQYVKKVTNYYNEVNVNVFSEISSGNACFDLMNKNNFYAAAYELNGNCYKDAEHDVNENNIIASSECSGMNKGTWCMKYDGIIESEKFKGKKYYGQALCSNTQAGYATAGNPDTTSPGPYCWCKIPSSSWVVVSNVGIIDTDWCVANCASYCTDRMWNGWKYFWKALGLDS